MSARRRGPLDQLGWSTAQGDALLAGWLAWQSGTSLPPSLPSTEVRPWTVGWIAAAVEAEAPPEWERMRSAGSTAVAGAMLRSAAGVAEVIARRRPDA